MQAEKVAVFVFPGAAGHINPSLPLARGLVAQGWTVEYLANTVFKEAIEDTGASFCDRDIVFRERGVDDVTAAVMSTATDYSEHMIQRALPHASAAPTTSEVR